MQVVKVTGVNTVIRNLKQWGVKAEVGIENGLIRAGRYLQRESQKIVPKQTGDLHNSAYCRNVGRHGFKADIVVGYTAFYAVYVHEDLDKLHGTAFNIVHAKEIEAAKGTKKGTTEGGMFKRGPNQQAKYLEKPAREKKPEIIRIIYSEVK